MGDVAGGREAEPRAPVEGPAAAAVRAHRQATPLAQALAAAGDRWTLLIVLACSDGTLRLNGLRSRLPGVSSAVLDHHVRQMVALGLLSRRRFREMPPRVELTLTESGAGLLPIASALARWGMRYRLSEQYDGYEHLDPDAVLYQLPALLEGAKLPDGTLEAVVEQREQTVVHRFTTVAGRLRALSGTPADAGAKASTSVRGERTAWQAALGPRRDYSGLRVRGRQQLARHLLDALPR
jgi:DNA-binding HxlR family transcriptional regulator